MKATFKTLYAAYLSGVNACDITANASTAKSNFNALMKILSIDKITADSQLTACKPNIIKRWRTHEAAKPENANQPKAAINYKLNCRLRLAKSVFSSQAQEIYTEKQIKIPPPLLEIANAKAFKPETSQTFKPIDIETDAKIRNEARRILDSLASEYEDQSAREARLLAKIAIMVEMARLCGMTRKEIHYFRPSWIINTAHGKFIDIREDGNGFTTKHSTKNRTIPVSHEALKRWQPHFPKDDSTLFGDWQSSTSPHSIYSQTSKWLRQFIPNRQKSLHELRKMACSDILDREKDIYLAAKFIGDRVDTTARYYAAQLRTIAPLE